MRRSGRLVKGAILFVGLVLLCANIASASSISVVGTPTDTATDLAISWSWNDSSGGGINQFNGTYWQADLKIIPSTATPSQYTATIWGFQHKLGPHPEDNMPAPYNFEFIFGLDAGPGTVIDQSGSYAHPTTSGHPDHYDLWRFVFTRKDAGPDTITLTANHVPIPAAAWLLGSGLVGLVVIRRRKLS